MSRAATPALGLAGLWFLLHWVGCAAVRSEFYRDEVRGLYDRGCDRYRAGDLPGAAALFERVTDVDPGYAEAHIVLGHIALAQGDPHRAEYHLRTALAEDASWSDAVMPVLLAIDTQRRQRAIAAADLDLAAVLSLLSTGGEALIQRTFETASGLDATAMDATSLSPAERSSLASLVVRRLLTGKASTREACFGGLFLMETGRHLSLAARAIASCPADILPAEATRRRLVDLHLQMGDPAMAMAVAQAGAVDSLTSEVLEQITGIPSEAFAAAADSAPGGAAPGAPPDVPPPAWFRLLEPD